MARVAARVGGPRRGPVGRAGRWWDRSARRGSVGARVHAHPAGAPAAVTVAGATTAPSAPELTDVVASVRDSVVTITSEGFSARGFGQIPSTGVGSGVILSADGYILTNRHVVSGSQSLTVELADGRQFPATIVKQSDKTDLALVKIDASGLKPAVIGDAATTPVGATVIAIGSPLGTFTETVTKGILSGDRPDDHGPGRGDRPAGDAHRTCSRPTRRSTPATAAGRCSTRTARVIGINTAVSTDAQGLGFAIPISEAAALIAQATGSPAS